MTPSARRNLLHMSLVSALLAAAGSVGLPACGQGAQGPGAHEPGAENRTPEAAAVRRRRAQLAARCEDAVMGSKRAPIRRLSQLEYENTLRDLFPGVDLPELEVVPDERTQGFDNLAAGQQPSRLSVERYDRTARKVAEAAVAERAAWAACQQTDQACVTRTLLTLAERAYRRPLTEDDRQRLDAFVQQMAGDLQAPPEETLTLGIAAILQSPSFLYRPEYGTGRRLSAGTVRLSGRELANRLSYFLWASMPDATLLAAAESGALATAEGLRRQAERLLSDSRARPVVNGFFAQWLGLNKLDEMELERSAFPAFDEVLRADLRASGMAYIDYAVWQLDSWKALMAGDFGFVNDRLAPLFGVAPPGSDKLVRVQLPRDERRGVLTQPAVLAATSHGIRHSPILRGVHVLNRIMCADLPDPPADVFNQPDLLVDESAICTTRDDVSMTHTAKPGCVACHGAIDAAGFNFEHYDALGRFRSTENGCRVDASGAYPGTDLIGAMPDAVALAEQLPTSQTASMCLARHLFRYGLGRSESEADTCEVYALAGPLLGGNDSLQALILSLVTSPSFRSRPAGAEPGSATASRAPAREPSAR